MAHILVIEDDKPTRVQISKLLRLEGYEVTQAEDGLEGFEKAIEVQPDLVVCDIMMPRLDGYGTLLRMHENPKTSLIPFIFLTAKSQIADLRKGMELGADDYLTKPISPPSLFNSIARRLEKREKQKQEAQRIKEELSLDLAVAIPGEIKSSLDRIVTLSNLITLKFSDQDKQSIEICESLNTELAGIERSIRRINLFGRLPKLYANRFREKLMSHASGSCNTGSVEAIAQRVARQLDRSDDLEVSVSIFRIQVAWEYLEILVEELLRNAFAASAPGTKVSLSLIEESELASLTVSDSGCGIDETKREELLAFSQFGQINTDSERLCLGIPLVQGITRLHGGEFSLEPNPDGGEVASVFLPQEVLVTESSDS